MGKLRFEPKVKPLVSEKEYQGYKESLLQAQAASLKNFVYWDLDSDENPNKMKKIFLHVAEKEGIPLKIRADRAKNSLRLIFGASAKASGRMPAKDSKKRILDVLSTAGGPLKKSEIVEKAGISTSTWNLRIKDLLASGRVKRVGTGRETRYMPA